jgi:hypothetical protein
LGVSDVGSLPKKWAKMGKTYFFLIHGEAWKTWEKLDCSDLNQIFKWVRKGLLFIWTPL